MRSFTPSGRAGIGREPQFRFGGPQHRPTSPPRSLSWVMASASERASLSAAIARRNWRLAASNSKALANQMVQVSTEASTRPIITALTTMSAAMNIPHGDRSCGSVSATAEGGTAIDWEDTGGVCAKAIVVRSKPRHRAIRKAGRTLVFRTGRFISSQSYTSDLHAAHSRFDTPTKYPRRSPYCGAKTPMPEPSRSS